MKRFNTTGVCIVDKHYMCDVSAKFNRCKTLIENGSYYAINFPRQYGKTTIKALLANFFASKNNYAVISISFEGIGDEAFKSEIHLIKMFISLLVEELQFFNISVANYLEEQINKINNFKDLQNLISLFIDKLNTKTILLIDEVDKASNNQVFVSFLASLRDRFLKSQEKKITVFHSVVLLGVHDVKTLKLKLRPDEEQKLNSPWNIAEDLSIDFAFTQQEIKPMLEDYAQEHNLKMPVTDLSQRLYYYTSGNPFLVSKMCALIDENQIQRHSANWCIEDIDKAYKYLIDGNYTTTNFDDMYKNLENNSDLRAVLSSIIIDGNIIPFDIGDPIIAKGKTFGLLCSGLDNRCDISNKIYEFRMLNYFIAKNLTEEVQLSSKYTSAKFKENNQLNITLILQKFQQFMQEHNSSKDNTFLEKNGRLLLMSFLRPIINGKGYMFKENVTAEDRKMDLVITYNDKRYVIELKIWYGEKYLQEGIEQLCDYLDSYNLDSGHILIYNFNKSKKYEIQKVPNCKKDITAVFV